MKKLLLLCALALAICAAGLAAAEEIPVAYADATSWIVSTQDPGRYAPERLIDGDESTAFQFSTQTTPLGQEYIWFALGWETDLRCIWMKNGFWRITDGLDQYTRNSRVKTMQVDFLYADAYDYADPITVDLPDDSERAGWIVIPLTGKTRVTGVRFRVDAAYTGTRYPNDVCISEVRFTGGTGSSSSSSSSGQSSGELWGLATQRISTRSGPGTTFQETGTYYLENQYVRVLTRAWDGVNEIWWVKCEIPYNGERRQLWTGYKRFDSATLPLESIPLDPWY